MKKANHLEETGRMEKINPVYEKTVEKKKKSGCLSIVGKFFLWLFFMFLGILLIGIYLGLTHPAFQLDIINITGNHRNDQNVVLKAGKVKVGDNIFRIKRRELEENLRSLPGVTHCQVTKVYPNQLNIDLEEQYDIGYAKADERYYIVDNHGKVSDVRDEMGDLEFEIEFVGFSHLTKDSPVDPTVSSLIEYWKESDSLSNIERIDGSEKDNIKVTINEIVISLGSGEKALNNAKIARTILQEIKSKHLSISEIIMNVGKNPILVNKE